MKSDEFLAMLGDETPALGADEKAAFRALIVNAANPLEPQAAFFGRSALEMAIWGMAGEDLGDGTFAYERADGFEDFGKIFSRATALARQEQDLIMLECGLSLWNAQKRASADMAEWLAAKTNIPFENWLAIR